MDEPILATTAQPSADDAPRNPTRTQRAGGPQMPSGTVEFYRPPPPNLETKEHAS